jgi:hypothetical protein
MKNKTTMVEYCLKIIKSVSFDRRLFIKEYRKSLKWLSEHESSQLKRLLRQDSHMLLHTAKNT